MPFQMRLRRLQLEPLSVDEPTHCQKIRFVFWKLYPHSEGLILQRVLY